MAEKIRIGERINREIESYKTALCEFFTDREEESPDERTRQELQNRLVSIFLRDDGQIEDGQPPVLNNRQNERLASELKRFCDLLDKIGGVMRQKEILKILG